VRGRIILLSFFILSLCKSSYSQDNDFGIWYGFNSEFAINKKLELDVSAMLRTFKNASKPEQSFLEAGLSYKFNKFISVAGSYRLTNNIEDDDLYHLRHKFMSDLKGRLPYKDLVFSARIRLQTQTREYIEPGDDKTVNFAGRIRFKCLYNIPKFPVNPYFAFESFSPIFDKSDRIIGKERITAGFEYKIVKKHSIELEYIFERDYIPRESDMSIISATYNVKF
jgi:hypothetical protein